MRRTAVPFLVLAAMPLSGCVTARLHSQEELAVVERDCGLGAGELIQEQELKRVLFLVRVAPPLEQRGCVYRWARRNHLNLAIIDSVNWTAP
jgi:hypothetical protein